MRCPQITREKVLLILLLPSEWEMKSTWGKCPQNWMESTIQSRGFFALWRQIYPQSLQEKTLSQNWPLNSNSSGDFIHVYKSLTWKRNFEDIDIYICKYVHTYILVMSPSRAGSSHSSSWRIFSSARLGSWPFHFSSKLKIGQKWAEIHFCNKLVLKMTKLCT